MRRSTRTAAASASRPPGHLPPLLLPRRALFLEGGSPPLGVVLPGVPRGQAELTLAAGEGLLLYTDGLVERRGEAIDTGSTASPPPCAIGRTCAPDALVEALYDELLRDAAGDDDVCLLYFQRCP